MSGTVGPLDLARNALMAVFVPSQVVSGMHVSTTTGGTHLNLAAKPVGIGAEPTDSPPADSPPGTAGPRPPRPGRARSGPRKAPGQVGGQGQGRAGGGRGRAGIQGTDQIRAEIHCKGVRRGGSSSSNAEAPGRAQAPWLPVPREPTFVEFHDQGSTWCAACAAAAVDRRPGPTKGASGSALGDQLFSQNVRFFLTEPRRGDVVVAVPRPIRPPAVPVELGQPRRGDPPHAFRPRSPRSAPTSPA